jgi:hypothetical protein
MDAKARAALAAKATNMARARRVPRLLLLLRRRRVEEELLAAVAAV